MRIRYHKQALRVLPSGKSCRFEIDADEDHPLCQAYLCRAQCNTTGFTTEELNAAVSTPLIWINSSRSSGTDSEERSLAATALEEIAAGPVDEPQIDLTGDYLTGLHCGLEDQNIDDRYDACDYGFWKGVERACEWAQGIAQGAIDAAPTPKQTSQNSEKNPESA